MTTTLAVLPSPMVLPARLFAPTPKAAQRVVEFFTAQINNDHTRKAYLNAARIRGPSRSSAALDPEPTAQTDPSRSLIFAFGTALPAPHLPFAIPVGTRSVGWFAARQLSGDEPAEADAYLLSSRPITTCVARSVAVDSITR
jgi:hypothetical protein